jgi:hypothetical protein
MVPLEVRDRAQFGKVYKLSIRLIEEVLLNERQREILASAGSLQYRPLMYRISKLSKDAAPSERRPNDTSDFTHAQSPAGPKLSEPVTLHDPFCVIIRLQSGRDPRLYFRIGSEEFQAQTGVTIEEGGYYKARVRIDGIGGFEKTLRSLAARQDIPFYVPTQLSNRLHVGDKVDVIVESMEKILRNSDWDTKQAIDIGDWTWRDIAAWIDTEGTIHASQLGSRYLRIGQKEKKIIQQICAFLHRHGILCSIILDMHTGVYYVSLDRTEHIAMVIKNVEPHIRTEKKMRDIAAFKKYLALPRKRLHASVLEARKILGIEQPAAEASD